MLRGVLLVVCVLLLLTFAATFAQQSSEVGTANLYRYGELLQQHHIELTKSALLRALKNSDEAVRYLAAMKLAEDKSVDAIPAIEEALAVERVLRDRVNIALALGLLGDQTGPTELKKVCAGTNFVREFRLYAVRYMFDLHFQKDEDCLHAAEEIVESKKIDSGDRISALELLQRFQTLTAEESDKVLKLVLKRLEDSEPVVRMAAGNAVASLGNASAIPYLEAAIAREQDESVRSVFERDMKKLQEKTQP